jgi:hypothetical protein
MAFKSPREWLDVRQEGDHMLFNPATDLATRFAVQCPDLALDRYRLREIRPACDRARFNGTFLFHPPCRNTFDRLFGALKRIA